MTEPQLLRSTQVRDLPQDRYGRLFSDCEMETCNLTVKSSTGVKMPVMGKLYGEIKKIRTIKLPI